MAHQPPTGDQIGCVDLPPPPAPAPEPQRFILTPFLTKTYQLVDDLSIDNIISWNEEGTAFIIWNPAEFARDVLPKYFKHNNFSSFVRQLNTYGFRKVMPDRWEFSNDCFRRGDKRLLCDIVRRKMTVGTSSVLAAVPVPVPMEQQSTSPSGEGQVFSSNSTPSSAAPSATLFVDQSNCNSNNNNNNNSSSSNIGGCGIGSSSRAHLIDENDRLKKENTQLCKELTQMKSMCTNIYSMMSNYNPGQASVPGPAHGRGLPLIGATGCGSSNSSQAESIMNPLDLLSGHRLLAAAVETRALQAVTAAAAAEDDMNLNPRLFGFQLGSKRARGGESTRVESSGEPMEQDDLLQLQQPGSSRSS